MDLNNRGTGKVASKLCTLGLLGHGVTPFGKFPTFMFTS